MDCIKYTKTNNQGSTELTTEEIKEYEEAIKEFNELTKHKLKDYKSDDNGYEELKDN